MADAKRSLWRPLQSLEEAAALSSAQRNAYSQHLQKQLKLLLEVDLGIMESPSQQPLAGTSVFRSKNFSDGAILKQLVSEKYQTPLSAHKWSKLNVLGPCFVTMAQAGNEAAACSGDVTAAMTSVLQNNTVFPAELKQHLLGHLPVVFGAMREIAESYLSRSLPKAPASAQVGDEQPVGLHPETRASGVLKGTNGMYRPVSFINKGSAGKVFSGVMLSATSNSTGGGAAGSRFNRWAIVRKHVFPTRKVRTGFKVESDIVLKKINHTQKDSAENEYRIASKLAKSGGEQ